MKVIILKDFKSKDVVYRKNDVIDIDVSLYHRLSLKGLVKPYLPHIPEEQIPVLTEEFKRMFDEFAERIKKIPVAESFVKEYYPETHKRLIELDQILDEAFLTFNRELFIKTANTIESLLKACYYDEPYKELKSEPIETELNRFCVRCGGNRWLVQKPNSKASSIKCLTCGNLELNVRG